MTVAKKNLDDAKQNDGETEFLCAKYSDEQYCCFYVLNAYFLTKKM